MFGKLPASIPIQKLKLVQPQDRAGLARDRPATSKPAGSRDRAAVVGQASVLPRSRKPVSLVTCKEI